MTYTEFNFDESDSGLSFGTGSSVSETNRYLDLATSSSSYAATNSVSSLVGSGKNGTIVVRFNYEGTETGHYNFVFTLVLATHSYMLNVNGNNGKLTVETGGGTLGSSSGALFSTTQHSEFCVGITNVVGSNDFTVNYFGEESGTFTAVLPESQMHTIALDQLVFGNYKTSSASYGMQGKIYLFKTYETILSSTDIQLECDEATAAPSSSPTTSPTAFPTASPTVSPTDSPTTSPTVSPTNSPTTSPTVSPTSSPSVSPTVSPTMFPSVSPTNSPTNSPSESPTVDPFINTEATASVEARPWAMSFYAGFIPLGLLSLLRLRGMGSANLINRLPFYTLVLISTMALVYCTLFSFSTEHGSFTGAISAVTIVLLDLGFLLETLLISKYTHFPYFASISSSQQLGMLSAPVLYSMALLSLSAIVAFVLAFSTSGSASGYAAVVFLFLAAAPTVLVCVFADIVYRNRDTTSSKLLPQVVVCLGIAFFQLLAAVSWTVMAFKDESLDALVAIFLTSELITGCLFLIAFQGTPVTSSIYMLFVP